MGRCALPPFPPPPVFDTHTHVSQCGDAKATFTDSRSHSVTGWIRPQGRSGASSATLVERAMRRLLSTTESVADFRLFLCSATKMGASLEAMVLVRAFVAGESRPTGAETGGGG